MPFVISLFGFALAAGVLAAAQPSLPVRDLTGIVTGLSGTVLPGVTVVVRGGALPTVRMGSTGDDGRYRVEGLAPSVYDVDSSNPGSRNSSVASTWTVSAPPPRSTWSCRMRRSIPFEPCLEP